MTLLVHLCRPTDWVAQPEQDDYQGTATDKADGFIHMSPPELAEESANLYFTDAQTIFVLWIDTAPISSSIKYEPSSRGVDFPHLYAPLPRTAVVRLDQIDRSLDGKFYIDLDMAPA